MSLIRASGPHGSLFSLMTRATSSFFSSFSRSRGSGAGSGFNCEGKRQQHHEARDGDGPHSERGDGGRRDGYGKRMGGMGGLRLVGERPYQPHRRAQAGHECRGDDAGRGLHGGRCCNSSGAAAGDYHRRTCCGERRHSQRRMM